MPGIFAETGFVNQRLWMFDAETNREGFRIDEYTPAMQHAEGITGAMARRQHNMTGADRLTTREYHCLEAAVLDQQIRDLAFETHLATQGDDFGAHRRNHSSEPECTDVRLADIHYFFRRARTHKLVHHPAPIEFRILDLAVELAVGEQSGTALAKLHVGFRCENIFAPQRPGIGSTAAHVAATLQHDGFEPH